MSILDEIMAHKRNEVADRRQNVPLAELRRRAETLAQTHPATFIDALRAAIQAQGIAVCAEIKKASPSRGVIAEQMDAADVAGRYRAAGSAALSVLTESRYFQGQDADLVAAKKAAKLPCLRKDFVFDPYQIYEAKTLGADAVLLIVAALADEVLADLYALAKGLALDVLVEVHDAAEMERAAQLSPTLIGINNRNLHQFQTALSVSETLIDQAPAEALVIAESGISTRDDIQRLKACGINAYLIGESLMRQPDPGAALAALLAD